MSEVLLVDRGHVVAAISNVALPEPDPDACERCGAILRLGLWPWCPHGEPTLVMIAHGEVLRKHLGSSVKGPMRFGSIREEERYLSANNLVRLADVPETEGERNAFERAKERAAREREGRPDKIQPVPQSEAP